MCFDGILKSMQIIIYLSPLSGSEPASHVLYLSLLPCFLPVFTYVVFNVLNYFIHDFIFILMLVLNVNNNLAFQFSFEVYLLALIFIPLYPILRQFMSFA